MLGHRELTIDEYLAILRRRLWILLSLGAIAAGVAYLYARTLPNEYKSQALVLMQQPKVNQQFVMPVVDEQMDQRLETMKDQIFSPQRLRTLVEQLHLYAQLYPRTSAIARASLLQQALSISPVEPIGNSPGISGFTINVTLYDRYLAQKVCANITSQFLEANATWQAEEAQDTTSFLSAQISEAKRALDQQDSKLTAFKLQYLGRLPDDAQTNMDILASLNSQLEATTEGLNRAQQNKIYLESQLTQQLAAWKATRSGNNALTLEEQLAAMRSKLVLLQARYTNDYPDVIKLKQDIAQLQDKVNAAHVSSGSTASTSSSAQALSYAEPAQIQQLRQDIRQYNQTIQEKTQQQALLEKKINEYQQRVQMSPIVEQQYTELTRNYQSALDFYHNLLTKNAQANMGASLQRRQQGEDFRVVDPANLPSSPSGPKRPLYAGAGLVGGLCVGLAIVLWLELRDTLIRSERDIEFYLQAPALALVPLIEPLDSRPVKGVAKVSIEGAKHIPGPRVT